MAKRKTDSVLGLAALSAQSTFSTSMSLALSKNHHAVTKRERAIFKELYEQEVGIDALTSKIIFAMEKMNEVKRAGAADVLYTLQFIEETKADTSLTTYQAAFEELCNRLVQLSGRNSLGVVEVSSNLIAEEAARSLYPLEPEEEEDEEVAPAPPKTFWQVLLGG